MCNWMDKHYQVVGETLKPNLARPKGFSKQDGASLGCVPRNFPASRKATRAEQKLPPGSPLRAQTTIPLASIAQAPHMGTAPMSPKSLQTLRQSMSFHEHLPAPLFHLVRLALFCRRFHFRFQDDIFPLVSEKIRVAIRWGAAD